MNRGQSTLEKVMQDGPQDPLAAIFGSWRLWLLGAMFGALIAAAAYRLITPDYRARATVVVDNNLEDAWVYFPDRQLFQFLRRETDRLVELAWSDHVLESVTSQVPGITITELRTDSLQLSQPSDGGWHLYADHADPQMAARMATSWGESFVTAVRSATQASPRMQALRTELNELILTDPAPNDERLLEITAEMTALAEISKGVSPYVEIHLSAQAGVPQERSVSLATYLLVGSLAGALLLSLVSFLVLSNNKERKAC